MRALLAAVGMLAICSQQMAWAQTRPDVGIKFEQTPDTVVFDFNIDEGQYSKVFYNTTVRNGESLVKLMFESETDQKFVRLHLANAIVPQNTAAQKTEKGAQITFSKAEPGQIWRNVINFASDEALQATLPVVAAGNNLQITASEYEDVSAVVARELQKVEGIQYTEADLQQLSSMFSDAFDKSTPYCLTSNFCLCSPPLVFDGSKCVSAKPWTNFQHLFVSQSAIQVQTDAESAPQVLTETDLLSLDGDTFNRIFDAYQKRVAKQQIWPYLLYAQSLKGSKALVVGGGMTQFEPLILARSGVNVTVVDSNLGNLKLLQSLAESSGTPQHLFHLIHVRTLEELSGLAGGYDAVFALDSLTRAPTELLADLYASFLSKLKIGGRWIQLAPSKSRYTSEGSPTYRQFATIYSKHLGVQPEQVWYEWLDLSKLMTLLSKTKARFQVIFNGEVGAYPSQYPDSFVFMDLVYLGQA